MVVSVIANAIGHGGYELYFVINTIYQKNEKLYVATNPYIVLNEVLHGVTTQKKKTCTIGYNF
jgi:hypothetical protein